MHIGSCAQLSIWMLGAHTRVLTPVNQPLLPTEPPSLVSPPPTSHLMFISQHPLPPEERMGPFLSVATKEFPSGSLEG